MSQEVQILSRELFLFHCINTIPISLYHLNFNLVIAYSINRMLSAYQGAMTSC
jgi:hypothetical protein